jgi:hypothetical protein
MWLVRYFTIYQGLRPSRGAAGSWPEGGLDFFYFFPPDGCKSFKFEIWGLSMGVYLTGVGLWALVFGEAPHLVKPEV